MHWEHIVLGYASYLAAASCTRRDFEKARVPLIIAAVAAWAGFIVFGRVRLSPTLSVVLPSLILLTGYWLSGLLFVRPNVRLERWLQTVDHRMLTQSGLLAWFHGAPRVVREYFELSYLLVYLAVPAGATTLVVSGHAAQVDRFWTMVLLAEFACYGMLPWIPTRPPRAIENDEHSARHHIGVRRLNLAIVSQASIQVNTLPSGHAAGAFATALAVGSLLPLAGVVFLLLATSIAIATVLGRYHYVADTVLGVLVAIAAWRLI
jgi:membrane-associated phospholipid phosphatase